ncbi:hypothetical protein ACP4OV_031708 [Aristida adscensionis]
MPQKMSLIRYWHSCQMNQPFLAATCEKNCLAIASKAGTALRFLQPEAKAQWSPV